MTTRELPAAEPRVETGPVRFGDDWAGVFIRGDNAFAYILAIDHFLKGGFSRSHDQFDPIQLMMLTGLRAELAACIQGPSGDALRAPPRELVERTYGETQSFDLKTGRPVETPPELKRQMDAALRYATHMTLEALGNAPLETSEAEAEPIGDGWDANGSPV